MTDSSNSNAATLLERVKALNDPKKLFEVLQAAAALENIVPCTRTVIDQNTKKPRSEEGYTFQNIDNLVFQGGGVKGVAYLGVVQEFERNHGDLLKNVKRVAGTSAGSMVALYISLNMNSDAIGKLLLENEFAVYLDSDINIPVTIPGKWWGTQERSYKVKHILGRFLEFMANIYTNLNSSFLGFNSSDTDLTAFLLDGMNYYNLLDDLGWAKKAAIKTLPTSVIAKFLPLDSIKNSIKGLRTLLEGIKVDPTPYETAGGNPPLQGTVLHNAVAELLGDTFFKEYQGNLKTVGNPPEAVDHCCMFSGRTVKDNLIYGPIKSQINNVVKYYRRTVQKDGKQSTEIVEFKSILPPFAVDKATFGDLDNCFEDKEGKKKCFKSLYVTAFNTRTLQTVVFSAEHTPGVTVADAIRASMGIPVFFSSTTIRENGQVVMSDYYDKDSQKKADNQQKTGDELEKEKIRYFDGGVFDNFALWIFDDLKYYSDEWAGLNVRFHIENPKTLGFKLYDRKAEQDSLKTNESKIEDKVNKPTSLGGFLLGSFVGGFQDNVFDRGNQAQRTVFVDNCQVSTIAFKATPEQRQNLVDSGAQSIQQYFTKRNEAAGKTGSKELNQK